MTHLVEEHDETLGFFAPFLTVLPLGRPRLCLGLDCMPELVTASTQTSTSLPIVGLYAVVVVEHLASDTSGLVVRSPSNVMTLPIYYLAMK